MASAAATRTLQQLDLLVRLVVRAFYEPGHVIVADALVREKKYMKDEDLAAKLKLHYKQIRKYLNDLKRDRIVKSEVRAEANTGTDAAPLPVYRKTTFEFYYIDYKSFVDVVKWKINAMNKMLDRDQRPIYQCPRCKMTFTDLQMNELLNFMTGKAECSRCKHEIESVAPPDSGGGVLSQVAFNKQLKPIKERLRELEEVEIPFLDRGRMDITSELTKQLARKASNTSGGGAGHAQSTGEKRGRDYDFQGTLDVEIVTTEVEQYAAGGAQLKHTKPAAADAAPGKGIVPWMAGAQKAAAIAAEKKQEKEAVEQAQAAAKPQAEEWNQRFFKELHRQEKDAAASAAAATSQPAEQTADVDGDAAVAAAEGEEDEEKVEVGTELVALSAVTQEHIDKMSPAQYEKYAAAYKKRIEEYNASVMGAAL